MTAADMKRVLQVNVRLSEGGAAGVARTLHQTLPALGWASTLAYGYGPSGGASPLAQQLTALRLTSRPRSAVNLAAHRLFGRELIGPAAVSEQQLREQIQLADVVHLHAIHSYMLDPHKLLWMIADAGKPLVWTMHDQWLMTGRCAQPGDCRGWETGCDPCPFKNAYPPALVDRAASQFISRRDTLQAIRRKIPVEVVSCAKWLGRELQTAGIPDVSVITNSVDVEFWERTQLTSRSVADRGLLFLSRDLRDKAKVNLQILREAASSYSGQFTIVGDGASVELRGVQQRPAVSDRLAMVDLMMRHSHLLFTSKVDYFPLTLVEALTAGMRIIAADSPAAREFENHRNVRIVRGDERWASVVASELHSPNDGLSEGSTEFRPEKMAASYAAVYERLA